MWRAAYKHHLQTQELGNDVLVNSHFVKIATQGQGCGSAAQFLAGKHETLSSIPGTKKENSFKKKVIKTSTRQKDCTWTLGCESNNPLRKTQANLEKVSKGVRSPAGEQEADKGDGQALLGSALVCLKLRQNCGAIVHRQGWQLSD